MINLAILDKYNIYLGLLLISTCLIVALSVFLLFLRNKKQIHYTFFSLVFSSFIWNSGVLVKIFFPNNSICDIIAERLFYTGTIFLSVSILFTGIIFAKTYIKLSPIHLLLFIIPSISLLILFTNNYHHLFMLKFSLYIPEMVRGKYFVIHTIYSYGCIGIGLGYLVFFSMKNSGFFSRQSLLITIGTVIPFITDTTSTFKLFNGIVYIENISFSFAIICYWFAINKYDFLNVIPIALQNIVDHISDGYIVINEYYQIVDYNKTFTDMFRSLVVINRKDNFIDIINKNLFLCTNVPDLINIIHEAKIKNETKILKHHIQKDNYDKLFNIEISCINPQKNIGTIILFKDITEIELTYKRFVERQKFAAIGEFTSGFTHSSGSLVSAMLNNAEFLKGRLYSYERLFEYIEDEKERTKSLKIFHKILESVNTQFEIAEKLKSLIHNINKQVSDLSTTDEDEENSSFTLVEIIQDLNFYANVYLKEKGYRLEIKDDNVNLNTRIKGKLTYFTRIIFDMFTNSVFEYEKTNKAKGTPIIFQIVQNNIDIKFSVIDSGRGVPEEVYQKLFTQSYTTKGKDGTGIGLYMAYNNIYGRFNGELKLDKDYREGAKFDIIIPIIS